MRRKGRRRGGVGESGNGRSGLYIHEGKSIERSQLEYDLERVAEGENKLKRRCGRAKDLKLHTRIF